VVITRGHRDDPHLGQLEEARWRLELELDEEEALEAARLLAVSSGGWITTFKPPWFDPMESPIRWEVQQWRKDGEGNEVERALRPISVPEVLDVVPMRFHSWVIDITAEALAVLEEVGPELGEIESDLDSGAAALAEVSILRSELEAARELKEALKRQRDRFYGDYYIYEFSPETDLYWRLDAAPDGAECLIARDVEDADDSGARALFPPDEFTPWRWTTPSEPESGGEYLTPADALTKVPKEFAGWVATKTYEVFQRTRHALHELSASSLLETQDFAQVVRLGKHAQQLAAISQSAVSAYPGSPRVEEDDLVAVTASPEGRAVLLLTRSWNHIMDGHPELTDDLNIVMKTVEDPDHREPDVRTGRERFFRRGGPEGWVRVVVEIAGPFDKIVTAFPQANRPERWRRK
jgi:hypothetical protein